MSAWSYSRLYSWKCISSDKSSNGHQGDPTISRDPFPGPNYQEITTEAHKLAFSVYASGPLMLRTDVQACWATDQGLTRLVQKYMNIRQR